MNVYARIAGRLAERQIKRRISSGRIVPPTQKKGGRTLVRHSHLLKSIKYRVEGNTAVISAGNANIPYARIHHEGGVIKPVRAQYLAIPLTAKAALYNARDYPGETFVSKGMIFEKEEGKKKPTPLYVLKRSVTMPARPYMFLDSDDMRIIQRAIEEQMQKEFRGNA